MPGIDEPLADAIAQALASEAVPGQVALGQPEARRGRRTRLRPKMKLDELLTEWVGPPPATSSCRGPCTEPPRKDELDSVGADRTAGASDCQALVTQRLSALA